MLYNVNINKGVDNIEQLNYNNFILNVKMSIFNGGNVMDKARMLGHNIALIMKEKNIDANHLAEQTGFKSVELIKMLDARIVLMPKVIEKVAAALKVNPSEFFKKRESNEYKCFAECMTDFDNPDNMDKILDIIDAYCDLKEVLN